MPKPKKPKNPDGLITRRTRTVVFDSMLVPDASLGAYQSQYGNICGACEKRIPPGSWVVQDGEDVIGISCCNGINPNSDRREDITTVMDDEEIPADTVMPRGRSKADMCPKCFQIPSGSGACGCTE